MEVTIRQAKREDAQQMLQVYNNFTKQFVGSASRTTKNFRNMLRRKDNINWVALDNQKRIIGYAQGRLEQRLKQGEFREIAVDPTHNFEDVAKLLIEKINTIFMEENVPSIVAGSVQNPAYQKLFLKMGFFESESTEVFMYAILNVQKFLNELSPVFASCLRQVKKWNRCVQIECEGQNLFLQKTGENVQQIVWTNQPANLKITLDRELLTKLIFGIADPIELHQASQLQVETTESSEKTNQLLKMLFPKRQFLIMDYW